MIFNVGAGGASTAEAVQYDNKESGLEATNVQEALDEVNDSSIKYKTLEFDSTFSNNSSTVIYDYSNDEDLKDAEIIGIATIGINLFTTFSWTTFYVDKTKKTISLVVQAGQRIAGTYSVLYK